MSPLEQAVKNCCFGGRSEGFTVGYTKSTFYNDVKSLYPCSLVATRALEITGAEPCEPSEIVISDDLNNKDFGWLEGVFQSQNDYWALPLRGSSNMYVTGVVSGFYHSFDLAASKAKVLHASHAYKPIWNPLKHVKPHVVARDLLLKRLEGSLPENESKYVKAVLNSLSGKLGESQGEKKIFARTSNFYSYSTLLAHSHLVMSKLFDKCSSPVLAMDTNSIFSQSNMAGKHFELTDGELDFLLSMSVKASGDLAFFSSKNYIVWDKNKPYQPFHKVEPNPVFGRQKWHYPWEDFIKLFDGITELHSRLDVKHTLLARIKSAKEMAKGRWYTKPVHLGLDDLKSLLEADKKRYRNTYDSYQLILDRKNRESRAWSLEEIMSMPSNLLGYPKFEIEEIWCV